jgi:hypothetical protein
MDNPSLPLPEARIGKMSLTLEKAKSGPKDNFTPLRHEIIGKHEISRLLASQRKTPRCSSVSPSLPKDE